jgi:hypothetical protein
VLTRRPGEGRIDLGIIDVDPKPERYSHISFECTGTWKRGLVDQIDPYDSEERPGTTPRIRLAFNEGEYRLKNWQLYTSRIRQLGVQSQGVVKRV